MSHSQGDPSDPELIVHELSELHQKLHRRYRHVDVHLLDASIEDALLHYRGCPEQFDASRGSLGSYLTCRTRHYLNVRLRKLRRRQRHENAVGISERDFEKIVSGLRTERCIYIGEDGSQEEAEEREEELARERALLCAIMEQLNPLDRAGVQFLLAGAAREEWVRHLRIEDLPREEQQRKIDGEKDRLRKKLKRRAQKMQGGSRSIGVRVGAIGIGADGERESWRSQLRMQQSREANGSGARGHSSASCSSLSVCCCW